MGAIRIEAACSAYFLQQRVIRYQDYMNDLNSMSREKVVDAVIHIYHHWPALFVTIIWFLVQSPLERVALNWNQEIFTVYRSTCQKLVKIDGVVLLVEVTGGYAHICSVYISHLVSQHILTYINLHYSFIQTSSYEFLLTLLLKANIL